MGNFEKGNLDANELIKKVSQTKSNTAANEKEVNRFLNDNLSYEQANAVRELLSDKEKTAALLNSDAAKALFQKFFGGKGNG